MGVEIFLYGCAGLAFWHNAGHDRPLGLCDHHLLHYFGTSASFLHLFYIRNNEAAWKAAQAAAAAVSAAVGASVSMAPAMALGNDAAEGCGSGLASTVETLAEGIGALAAGSIIAATGLGSEHQHVE